MFGSVRSQVLTIEGTYKYKMKEEIVLWECSGMEVSVYL